MLHLVLLDLVVFSNCLSGFFDPIAELRSRQFLGDQGGHAVLQFLLEHFIPGSELDGPNCFASVERRSWSL